MTNVFVKMTHRERIAWYIQQGRTVSGGKGDKTVKQSETLSVQNQQAQMDFNKELMGIFEKQFASQQDVLNYIKGKMQPMIDNPTGFSDTAKAAMRTGATDTISSNYQNAQKALQAQRFAQGGRDIPSGVDDQLNAAMLDSEAQTKANAQNGITLQDENLKQANYWNAINTLSGTGAQFNPQSYAASATGAADAASTAGNATSNASQAYKASQQSQLLGALGGIAGGIGSAVGGIYCWVAAAHFGGWYDARTVLVRKYLMNDFGKRWYGAPVMWLYGRIGRRVSEQPWMVRSLGPLFDLALRNAMETI